MNSRKTLLILSPIILTTLSACSGGSSSGSTPKPDTAPSTATPDALPNNEQTFRKAQILVNQDPTNIKQFLNDPELVKRLLASHVGHNVIAHQAAPRESALESVLQTPRVIELMMLDQAIISILISHREALQKIYNSATLSTSGKTAIELMIADKQALSKLLDGPPEWLIDLLESSKKIKENNTALDLVISDRKLFALLANNPNSLKAQTFYTDQSQRFYNALKAHTATDTKGRIPLEDFLAHPPTAASSHYDGFLSRHIFKDTNTIKNKKTAFELLLDQPEAVDYLVQSPTLVQKVFDIEYPKNYLGKSAIDLLFDHPTAFKKIINTDSLDMAHILVKYTSSNPSRKQKIKGNPVAIEMIKMHLSAKDIKKYFMNDKEMTYTLLGLNNENNELELSDQSYSLILDYIHEIKSEQGVKKEAILKKILNNLRLPKLELKALKTDIALTNQTTPSIEVALPKAWQLILMIKKILAEQEKEVFNLDQVFNFTLYNDNNNKIIETAAKHHMQVRLQKRARKHGISTFDHNYDLTFTMLNADIKRVKIQPINGKVFKHNLKQQGVLWEWDVDITAPAVTTALDNVTALFTSAVTLPCTRQENTGITVNVCTVNGDHSLSEKGVQFLQANLESARVFRVDPRNTTDNHYPTPELLHQPKEREQDLEFLQSLGLDNEAFRLNTDNITTNSLNQFLGVPSQRFSNQALWINVVQSHRGDAKTQQRYNFNVIIEGSN